MIASSGQALLMLQKRFPDLRFIELPSYRVRYRFRDPVFNFLWMSPWVLWAVWKERQIVRRVVREYGVNLVISDNRLGCYTKKVPSVYMTHQLQFAFRQKWLSKLAAFLHLLWYKNYDEVWIPDNEHEPKIAGELSQPRFKGQYRYLGPLSQLSKLEEGITFQAMVILSGPEPSRTNLEYKLVEQLKAKEGKYLIVRGLPQLSETPWQEDGLQFYNFMGPEQLSTAIAQTALVICRSGYSSIMDLMFLGKSAILIPTPGQPEQEYLARYHQETPGFRSQKQATLDLKSDLKAEHFPVSQRQVKHNLPEVAQWIDDLC